MRSSSGHLPFWATYAVYFGLLLGAMYLTVPDPAALQIAYLFPAGAAAFFGLGSEVKVLFAYAIHLTFFILFAWVRDRPGVYLLWFAFIIYLLMNVSGCRRMLAGAQSIT